MRKPRLYSVMLLPIALLVTTAKADVVTNGTFDSGTLAGWTVFTTPNGTTGTGLPTVVSFNTTGTGTSNAAEFNVGEVIYNSTAQGGGLSQTITIPVSGTYTLSEFFATQSATPNADAGTYSLLINGVTVATDSLGIIGAGQTLRGSFDDSIYLAAGSYTLATEITRTYLSGIGITPTEYIDDISLSPAATTPEPSSFALFGTAIVGFAGVMRRRFRMI